MYLVLFWHSSPGSRRPSPVAGRRGLASFVGASTYVSSTVLKAPDKAHYLLNASCSLPILVAHIARISSCSTLPQSSNICFRGAAIQRKEKKSGQRWETSFYRDGNVKKKIKNFKILKFLEKKSKRQKCKKGMDFFPAHTLKRRRLAALGG